jgi:hypothetical protein
VQKSRYEHEPAAMPLGEVEVGEKRKLIYEIKSWLLSGIFTNYKVLANGYACFAVITEQPLQTSHPQ